jgi:DNA polymerase-1
MEDLETGKVISCTDDDPLRFPIQYGLNLLSEAEEIVGHNVINFDVPAIQKVYPKWKTKARVTDTMILARVLWADIKDADRKRVATGQLPAALTGRYSLEAFGYRLGLLKGTYAKDKGGDAWASWSDEMQRYCEQDVTVTVRLFRFAEVRWKDSKSEKPVPFSDGCIELEHKVAWIISRQQRWGFRFNVAKAQKLYGDLIARRFDLERELRQVFHPWFRGREIVVPKKSMVRRKNAPIGGDHTTEGAAYQKIELVEFNPNSRDHISDRLMKLRGWKPKDFGKDGKPTVDDTVLSKLPYPEAKPLAEYLMVQKRIGQIAEGAKAWLKVEKAGRIHGAVITNGAVTGRMTHFDPNVAQAPASYSPYGHECRDCFEHTLGRLVGCDADALELRCLAGYMAPIDGGAYIETVLKGDKSKGTDIHSVNARALGLDPKGSYVVDGKPLSGRDIAKTWFYAFIYGSGNENLGWIMGVRGDPMDPSHWDKKSNGAPVDKKAMAAGVRSRKTFLKNLPALGTLIDRIKAKADARGFLIGQDGRKLAVRSSHGAPNTLLQSAGAIFMKKALVILDERLHEEGYVPGVDYEFCANVHDEWQIDVREELAHTIGKLAADAIRLAGEAYNFPCPLAGNYDVGVTWAETH